MGKKCLLKKVQHLILNFFFSGTNTQFFKWNDITNLVNHKRYFGIECQNYERSVQFILDEPDSAKYVWKMCKLYFF